MRESLGLTIVLYAAGLAVVCVVAASLGGRRPAALPAGLVMLQVAVTGQGVVDAAALLRGEHGNEVTVNLGYLLTSLAVLPVVWSVTRLDPGRWGTLALGFGCLLVAVVSLRLHATLTAEL